MNRRKLIIIAIVLVTIPFMCYPLCSVFNDSVYYGKGTACLSNLKEMSMAQQLYAEDENGRLPNGQNWMDEIYPYTKNEWIFHCPDLDQRNKDDYGYAMNIMMFGANLNSLKDPRKKVLLFDSVILDRNACSNLVGFPNPPRHKGNNVAFADGHVVRRLTMPRGAK